jgi:hypothetical protein
LLFEIWEVDHALHPTGNVNTGNTHSVDKFRATKSLSY